MEKKETGKGFSSIHLSEQNIAVIVFSLFFSWLLSFPFQGQIFYTLARSVGFSSNSLIFEVIAAHFAGLFLCGFVIKTHWAARKLMLFSIAFCLTASFTFFFAPSHLWNIALISSSFLAGGCVAAWGFFLKSGTPKNERIKTSADGLIFSNILMILLNMAAIHISPRIGLGLSMLVLGAAFFFARRLPGAEPEVMPSCSKSLESHYGIARPLAFLCIFVVVITINSGLMYQVQGPAYAHLEWLTSWYWAIPYVVALYIMRNLPRRINRTYILYIAIAMIGFSYISFMLLDRSAASYLVVNTLMLGACGVYDLFWWSILGEMLDLTDNPAQILGMGLSANVLGVLLGGLVGNTIGDGPNSSLLAMAVVCVTLVILPPLHRHLTLVLKDHAYLTVISEMLPVERSKALDSFIAMGQLTGRESEIAQLLLKGKTYKAIAAELHVSENTVKTHIKNIYAKYKIQSRSELINLLLKQELSTLG